MSQVSVIDKDFPLEMPIYIACRPSFNIAIFNALIHLGAIGSLFPADIPSGAVILLISCVLLHLFYYIRQYRIRCETHVMLKLNKENKWELTGANGEIKDLDLLPGTFVHPCMVILRFKDECRRAYTYVLTTDNIERQTLRRLRVRLRFPAA